MHELSKFDLALGQFLPLLQSSAATAAATAAAIAILESHGFHPHGPQAPRAPEPEPLRPQPLPPSESPPSPQASGGVAPRDAHISQEGPPAGGLSTPPATPSTAIIEEFIQLEAPPPGPATSTLSDLLLEAPPTPSPALDIISDFCEHIVRPEGSRGGVLAQQDATSTLAQPHSTPAGAARSAALPLAAELSVPASAAPAWETSPRPSSRDPSGDAVTPSREGIESPISTMPSATPSNADADKASPGASHAGRTGHDGLPPRAAAAANAPQAPVEMLAAHSMSRGGTRAAGEARGTPPTPHPEATDTSMATLSPRAPESEYPDSPALPPRKDLPHHAGGLSERRGPRQVSASTPEPNYRDAAAHGTRGTGDSGGSDGYADWEAGAGERGNVVSGGGASEVHATGEHTWRSPAGDEAGGGSKVRTPSDEGSPPAPRWPATFELSDAGSSLEGASWDVGEAPVQGSSTPEGLRLQSPAGQHETTLQQRQVLPPLARGEPGVPPGAEKDTGEADVSAGGELPILPTGTVYDYAAAQVAMAANRVSVNNLETFSRLSEGTSNRSTAAQHTFSDLVSPANRQDSGKFGLPSPAETSEGSEGLASGPSSGGSRTPTRRRKTWRRAGASPQGSDERSVEADDRDSGAAGPRWREGTGADPMPSIYFQSSNGGMLPNEAPVPPVTRLEPVNELTFGNGVHPTVKLAAGQVWDWREPHGTSRTERRSPQAELR
ncbi:hypothetical protein CYMTET_12533 [Cymbomonas tetramitiformis]|uniref:Uncharacterized protein n=1 Tax=Cymbomonas tetramitiformis TaxID=36881 RepID=A0AAE0LCC3_9CHLO|nr:hypothetical protein CYMTET_12533 [Cymbomonas tetramitiformis]